MAIEGIEGNAYLTAAQLEPEPLEHVVVCSYQQLVAAATSSLLKARLVSHAVTPVTSASELFAAIRRRTDVVVVLDFPDDEFAELCEAFTHRSESTPILCAVSAPDAGRVARLLELGAGGVVERGCSVETFCRSVVEVALGRLAIPTGQRFEVMETIRLRRAQRFDARVRLSELAQRERVVLRLLADGKAPFEIGQQILVSIHTVRATIRTLGHKLGVRGQLRLAAVGRDLFGAAGPNATGRAFVSIAMSESRRFSATSPRRPA
jgi:DNA-binding NarL/FixJ family response regulator